MKVLKKILIYFILVIILFSITGCKEQDELERKQKIEQEMNYLDDKLISMLNRLNNISLENFSIVYNKIELSKETANSATSQSTGGERSK